MKYLKLFNESLWGRLMNTNDNKLYKYLGETNEGEWANTLNDILNTKSIIDLSESEKVMINNLIPNKKKIRGRRGESPEDYIVMYGELEEAVNSRFGYCWFFVGGDICIQPFSDEWYLVNIGDGRATFNYWYICDQFEGLKQLIEDKLEDS